MKTVKIFSKPSPRIGTKWSIMNKYHRDEQDASRQRHKSNIHGDAIFNEIFHPVAHAIATRCDACLRIGGPSAGADGMVDLARSLGQQVFYSLEEVPAAQA